MSSVSVAAKLLTKCCGKRTFQRQGFHLATQVLRIDLLDCRLRLGRAVTSPRLLHRLDRGLHIQTARVAAPSQALAQLAADLQMPTPRPDRLISRGRQPAHITQLTPLLDR